MMGRRRRWLGASELDYVVLKVVVFGKGENFGCTVGVVQASFQQGKTNVFSPLDSNDTESIWHIFEV